MTHRFARWLPVAAFALSVDAALAGQACDRAAPSPQALAAAADTALRVHDALEATGQPVVLVARAGTDLSRHGLVYSHVGFAVRDHPHGRWAVMHLLNRCGSDRSDVYAEGLVNFFADDLLRQDARLVQLRPELTETLAIRLRDGSASALHEPRYNLIARPGSRSYQNSTAWVLELLASLPLRGGVDRARAQAMASAEGFEGDLVHIPYGQRVLGGLFSANTVFTDHPLAVRLSGDYRVVTVRSIVDWLARNDRVLAQAEWRDGRWVDAPGPL